MASVKDADERFTDEERAAIKERASELKAAKRRAGKAPAGKAGGAKAGGAKADGAKADGESDLLAKVAEMGEPDRVMAERVHAIVQAAAPHLTSKTWYGMPAYAKDGNVICFFQSAQKFKSRYAMLGFSDKADLDDGAMWPTYFALKELTADAEARIEALVKRAAG